MLRRGFASLCFVKTQKRKQDKAREAFRRDVYLNVNEQEKRSATKYCAASLRFV